MSSNKLIEQSSATHWPAQGLVLPAVLPDPDSPARQANNGGAQSCKLSKVFNVIVTNNVSHNSFVNSEFVGSNTEDLPAKSSDSSSSASSTLCAPPTSTSSSPNLSRKAQDRAKIAQSRNTAVYDDGGIRGRMNNTALIKTIDAKVRAREVISSLKCKLIDTAHTLSAQDEQQLISLIVASKAKECRPEMFLSSNAGRHPLGAPLAQLGGHLIVLSFATIHQRAAEIERVMESVNKLYNTYPMLKGVVQLVDLNASTMCAASCWSSQVLSSVTVSPLPSNSVPPTKNDKNNDESVVLSETESDSEFECISVPQSGSGSISIPTHSEVAHSQPNLKRKRIPTEKARQQSHNQKRSKKTMNPELGDE